MAALKACSALVTGANRGLGLEMVKQLLEARCSNIFDACRDPDGPNSEEYLPYLRTAAKAKGKPGMSCDKAAVINISTDAASMSIMPVLKEPFPFFPYSISKVFKNPKTDGLQKIIKESAKKVGSLLGKNGLNLLVNNAAVLPQKTLLTATVEDMQSTFNTNVIGPLFVIREYLPYLRTAAKAKGKPGMSCDKAAVINISTDSASMSIMPVMKEPFPFFPYSISKAGLNMLTIYTARDLKADEILCISIHPGWVRTDMGGDKAPIDTRKSVEGLMRVIGSLTEKQNGAFLDYTGKTMPW
ncbi:hypothetical protein G5714_003246 [Onychostoma macrolepis]|uniref:C-factor n=1 Tax=Onychostoma macrolepis TaxID=369639 RepID=A0A7J6D8Y2_9TELE|nr:hypothetical protein G5714_003246 [Onychostoma macrolepis]